MRRILLLAAAVLAFSVCAQVGAQRAPSDEELVRFLTAFRATSGALVQMGRAARYHRARGEMRETDYYDCISRSLTAQTIEDAILPVARATFAAADDVNAMSDFFEGALGQKVVRQTLNALGRSGYRDSDWKATNFRFTESELMQLTAMEQGPPYAAFTAFTKLLNDRMAQSIHGHVFQMTRQVCETGTR
jgi:hypothetical protein